MSSFYADPHIADGDLVAWLSEPPGMVNRLRVPCRVTRQIATSMTVDVDAEMRKRWPNDKYVYVHDFSLGIGYDDDALRMLVEWGRNSMRDVAAIVVVISKSTAIYDKAAVHAGKIALKIFGVPMEISESLDEVVERYKLRPAGRERT
jgi:hypothetical protein